MSEIAELQKIDILSWLITGFLILSAINSSATIIGKFSETIGKPVKWVRKKQEDHCLLIKTSQSLDELWEQRKIDVEQSIKHDEILRDDLKKLTDMFVDKSIDDMRYEILDFASSLSSGRTYSKEQYDHVLNIYEKYEKILEENHLSNGKVNTSMEVIREIYKDKLKNGF